MQSALRWHVCLESFFSDFDAPLPNLSSKNCLREINGATSGGIPRVLVHETDVKHGGASLDSLRNDCHAQGCDAEALFDGHEVIPWHRAHDFMQISLNKIAEGMIPTMPTYKSTGRRPGLFLTGDLTTQTFEFRHKSIRLYASDANPGAADVAEELMVECTGLEVELRRPEEFRRDSSPLLRSTRRLSASLFPEMAVSLKKRVAWHSSFTLSRAVGAQRSFPAFPAITSSRASCSSRASRVSAFNRLSAIGGARNSTRANANLTHSTPLPFVPTPS